MNLETVAPLPPSAWRSDMPLKSLNTFGFDVTAKAGATVASEAMLERLLAVPALAGLRRFVIGGGSNLVLTGDVDALVLRIAIPGRRVVAATDDAFWVEAGAGEDWHGFVEWTIAQGMPGLENLALIPGTVGASPVQNIGAYGMELADRFDSLRALDMRTGVYQRFDAAACGFGYRDSVFKQAGRDRYVITAVTFRLPRRWQAVTAYADIEHALAARRIAVPTARDIFDAVVAIRRTKLPDPMHIGNAGSFFKNPVVDRQRFAALRSQEPEIVGYPQADGSVKLAAGWLIDRCGWKGRRHGNAAVHDRQALVLVNPGQANGRDVMALATAIVGDVMRRFGVALDIEPLVV